MKSKNGVSPIEKKQRQDCGEVGWGSVGWQVEHKENDDTTCGRHQVVELGKNMNSKKVFRHKAVHCRQGSLLVTCRPSASSHHVPDVVGQPVDDRVTAADKLQVLRLGRLLRHEEHHEAGWHKRHGHDDEDGDDHVSALEPEDAGGGGRR